MPFATVLSEDNTVTRMLKFKITTKGIRNAAEEKPCQDAMKIVLKHGDRATVGVKKCPETNRLVKQDSAVKSCKRKLETSHDVQSGKGQKMDRGLKFLCANILKELMNHPDGWVFSEPVDPVELQIPDYFSIITEPMDLGTIKRKLEGNVYFGVEEFVSDVGLTFSNAMLYNPPENSVHQVARILNGNFSRRWKSVEAKIKQRKQNVVQPSIAEDLGKNGEDSSKSVERNHQGVKPAGLDKAPLRIKLGTCRPMALEEKRSLRSEVIQLIDQKMSGNLQTVFQKFGLTDLNKQGVNSFINSTNDESLWKLRRELKVFLGAKSGKPRPVNVPLDGCSLLKKHKKENSGESIRKAGHHRDAYAGAKCSTCYNVVCHCQRKNGSQISISDISSDGSSALDHSADSKLDSEVKYHVAIHTSRCGVDSDGPGVVLNEESSPHLSTPAATALEGWNSFNAQMSPKKALRAAMLKSRFADTIFKATHQAVLDNKSDAFRAQQEKARLEKEQLEEKARIEAEIKAAKEASRRKEQDDMKMQRERERVAARMALEKMGKTVDIYENLDIMKDLEKLCCCYLYDRARGSKGICSQNPLERLGLFIKHDMEEDDDAAQDGGEEGEIL